MSLDPPPPPGPTKLIAQFRIDSKNLQFRWENCDDIAHVVNLLQNCLLEVRLANPERDVFIPLRTPVHRPPISFKALTAENHFRAMSSEKEAGSEVRFLPAEPNIVFGNVDIQGLPESYEKQIIEIKSNKLISFSIYVGNDLPVHFKVSLDPKDYRVTLAYEKVKGWGTVNPSKRNDKPTVKVVEEEIKNKEEEIKKNIEQKTTEQNKPEASDAKIKILDDEITKLKKLKAIIDSLSKNGELHYSISLEIGDHKITLLETSRTDMPQ